MNVTETDLAIAASFYPILVECARTRPVRKLTYGQLVARAKKSFPDLEAVQTAIPVSAGRRLEVVRRFLRQENLPDLTSLVVNSGTGEVGSAYAANPVTTRAEVSTFDWDSVAEEFDLHIANLRKDIPRRPKPKLSLAEAKELMSSYYQQHRASLPKDIASKREEIIEMIRSGISAEKAFRNGSVY